MIRRGLVLLATLCALAFPAGAQNCEGVKTGFDADRKPQNAARDIVGQSLDDIVERGYILFAVYEDFPPYSWRDGSTLRGVDIDLGTLIAKDLGVKARFYETAAGENVDADLRFNIWQGRPLGGQIANVMLHVPYNRELACRNEQVVLTGQYFNEEIAIAFRRDTYPDGGPTPAYFRFDKVGVENDSLADFYLSSFLNGALVAKMTRYPTPAAAMAGLQAGEVVAVMGARAQLEHGLTDALDIHQPPLAGLSLGTWTLGVAVRQNWRPLGYAVDDAIRAAVSDGRMQAIFNAYGLSYAPPDW